MMINKNDTRGTEESFRNGLRIQAIVFAVLIMLGLAVVILGNVIINGSVMISGSHRQDYSDGFFVGLGSPLIAVGIIRLIWTVRKLINSERFKESYTEYIDERNRFVLMKAYQTTAYIFIILLAFAIVVMNFINPVVTNALAVCLGAFSLILTITYRIMNKKY